ncbi:hypothetical protein ASPCAL11699 [Aspergillus calidoustus]|uniref:AB hydrolase-1 domain-containing protein n=1 Tax=Aspergillus calidoustus TaxID=454130 RepID=A0A0U5G9R9_ASPCI|nr:hypothetical protein ASPCAL11699 [Aspergillus calidoustus]
MSYPSCAIFIVHGAYFQPPAWSSFITRLEESSFTVKCPALSSCGTNPAHHPTGTLENDIHAVRTAAQKLIDAGHKIIVLAHSYGGIVASEVITPDLYGTSNPTGTGVTSLILLSAFLIHPENSWPGLFEKYGFQCEADLGHHEDGTVCVKNAVESLYNDIDTGRAKQLAAQNVRHNIAAAAGNITSAPWKDLATVYVHLSHDLAIKLPLQKSMVDDAVSAGGRVRTERLDAGHCAFLSCPDELVGIVLRVTGCC